MTDDELRTAYQRAMAARPPANRLHCPDPDTLLALVQRQGPESVRLETLDHTMSCPACRQDFELLRAIEAGERRESETEARMRMRRWQRPLALALAASLLLAVGVGPARDWWSARDPGTMRGDVTAFMLVGPEPDALVSPDSLRFTWRPVPGALRYTIELLTIEGAVRAARTTTDTSATLAGTQDTAAGEYRWWVRAELPGGERRSELRAVRIRRE